MQDQPRPEPADPARAVAQRHGFDAPRAVEAVRRALKAGAEGSPPGVRYWMRKARKEQERAVRRRKLGLSDP